MDLIAPFRTAPGKQRPRWHFLSLGAALIACFLVAGFMVSPHWFGPEPASAAGVPAVKAGNYANLTRFHMRF